LPDNIFGRQKYQFLYVLECPGVDDTGIFYDHLFHIFCGPLVQFFPVFGMLYITRKIWQNWSGVGNALCVRSAPAHYTAAGNRQLGSTIPKGRQL
jgi:hypothetical protein